jgi:enoyl-CoA hydratase/carnithine racemase
MLWHMRCFEALVEPEDFDATVHRLVGEIVDLAPLAVQATKQSLNEIASGQANLEAMRAREAMTFTSEDFTEGRRAFQEKRKARFAGR